MSFAFPHSLCLRARRYDEHAGTLHHGKCIATATAASSNSRSRGGRNRISRARLHSERIARIARIGDLPSLDAVVAAAIADGVVLNAVNRTTLANARATAGDLHGARKELQQMRMAGDKPTNVTLRVAIKIAQSSAEIVQLLEWFRENASEPAEVKSWNMALKKMAGARNSTDRKPTHKHPEYFHDLESGNQSASDMMRVLHLMLRHGCENGTVPKPDSYSFNSVMEGWRRCRDTQMAFSVFGLMRVSPLTAARPDVISFNTLLALCIERLHHQDSDFSRARSVLSRFISAMPRCMKCHKVKPDLVTHSLLLQALAHVHKRSGDMVRSISSSEAIDLSQSRSLESFLHKVPPQPPLRPRIQTKLHVVRALWRSAPVSRDKLFYNSLIAAFSRLGDLRGAVAALKAMSRSGNLEPDLCTYNSIMSGAAVVGNTELASTLLSTLKCHKKYFPDSFSFTSAITAYRNNPQQALKLLEDARQCGVPVTAPLLNAVLMSHDNDINAALRLWRGWRSTAGFPVVARDVQVYRALLRIAGIAGQPREALRIVHAGRKSGELEPSSTPGLFTAFEKGLREGNMTEKVESNLISCQYMQHLRLECRAFKAPSCLPIERVRIRF